MLRILCPHCGEHREEKEFHFKGQAHITRPNDPDTCDDKTWGDYLYFRKNIRGIHHEMWVHTLGCRKFFNVTRDTLTYEVHESYKIGEAPAAVEVS